MHRQLLILLSGILLSLYPGRAQDAFLAAPTDKEIPTQESHAELANELVSLLQRTATVLEQCTDAAAVEAATPQLKQLRAEAISLMARQAALPEPTVQDYLAAQNCANDFLDAKHAIQTHITRLLQQGLMTAEIREILSLPPELPPSDKQRQLVIKTFFIATIHKI